MTRYERGAERDWSHHAVDLSKCLTVWIDAAGVDAKELRREFEAGHYEQLRLRISRTANVPDLEFLAQIGGIRELDIIGPDGDLSPLAALASNGVRVGGTDY